MSPDESPRRALWMGLVVAVAFRVFAYGVFWVGLDQLDSRLPSPFRRDFVVNTICLMVMVSPLVIPFVAGFLGGYYWRRLSPHDYANPVFITNSVLLAGGWLITRYGFLFEVVVGGIFVALFDVSLCVIGGESGSKFWESRMARQFVGDFSVRDEDD